MTLRWTRTFGIATAIVAAFAAAATAQRYRLMEGPGVPIRVPPPGFSDGAFTVCKIQYSQVRYEEWGMGWGTDYPYAGINLMTRLGELTKTPISTDPSGNPNYWVVRLTDESLFRCPFAIASDVGTIGLRAEEVASLRNYLLKGGFLWVDDFWGTPAWLHWSDQMRSVLPEYRIVDVPPDHPVRRTLYEIKTVPQVTNIQNWRSTGGSTSERGADSPHANFRMIADASGRIMVLMTHNTDIGDSWEREGEDPEFFIQFSPEGYALGINVLLYAMSH